MADKPTIDQVQEFFRQVESGRVNRGNFQKYLENPDASAIGSTFKLTVQVITLEAMIAAGEYDWKNDNVMSKNFPVEVKEKYEVEVHLVHLNREATSLIAWRASTSSMMGVSSFSSSTPIGGITASPLPVPGGRQVALWFLDPMT